MVPVVVRWNSHFYALVCLQKKINKSSDRLKQLLVDLKLIPFSKEEVVWLSEYVIIMEPLATALNKLQGDISLGYALPTVVSVKNKLESLKHTVTIGKALDTTMLKAIDTRFAKFFDIPEFILSAVTTPKFKLGWLKEGPQRDHAKSLLTSEVKRQKALKETNSEEIPKEKEGESDDFYDSNTSINEEESDVVEDYLKSKMLTSSW